MMYWMLQQCMSWYINLLPHHLQKISKKYNLWCMKQNDLCHKIFKYPPLDSSHCWQWWQVTTEKLMRIYQVCVCNLEHRRFLGVYCIFRLAAGPQVRWYKMGMQRVFHTCPLPCTPSWKINIIVHPNLKCKCDGVPLC